MNIYELQERRTGKILSKLTFIQKIKKDEKEGYKLYSAYDECSYAYLNYSLKDAIIQYENDTRYQNYSSIRYFTNDSEVKEEFESIKTFLP